MKAKKTLLCILTALLVVEIAVAGIFHFSSNRPEEQPSATEVVLAATGEVTIPETELSDEPSEATVPTKPAETKPIETEPKEKRYVLSFAGDCTLGSVSKNWNNRNHFIQTIGENYDYPFDNVRDYFEKDDFTLINLEGPLTDSSSGAQSKTFAFRGPTAYTQIMTGSSVEAVTLANNHAEDYGKAGYESTTKVLKDAGITYVEKNGTAMYTTENGLKIGLYAAAFDFNTSDIQNSIAKLRKNGAEIVICAFHWGEEGVYRPDASQQKVAKASIDAGADIVYGHHPHVLQKIEQYNNGYIFYSLGNFSFGGAALPGDYDTALLQMEVIREENGKVHLGELTIIPCSISSISGQNNFQPTPLEPGEVYDRVLSKLDGSFSGPNLNVDYSKLDPKPAETTPPATQAPSGGSSATTPPASSGDSGSSGGETPAPDGGSGSSGDSGSSGSSETPAPGGDSGSSGNSGSSGGETPAPAPDPAPSPAPAPDPAPAPNPAPDSGSEG